MGDTIIVRSSASAGMLTFATVTSITAVSGHIIDVIPMGGDAIVVDDLVASPEVLAQLAFPGAVAADVHDLLRLERSFFWAIPFAGVWPLPRA